MIQEPSTQLRFWRNVRFVFFVSLIAAGTVFGFVKFVLPLFAKPEDDVRDDTRNSTPAAPPSSAPPPSGTSSPPSGTPSPPSAPAQPPAPTKTSLVVPVLIVVLLLLVGVGGVLWIRSRSALRRNVSSSQAEKIIRAGASYTPFTLIPSAKPAVFFMPHYHILQEPPDVTRKELEAGTLVSERLFFYKKFEEMLTQAHLAHKDVRLVSEMDSFALMKADDTARFTEREMKVVLPALRKNLLDKMPQQDVFFRSQKAALAAAYRKLSPEEQTLATKLARTDPYFFAVDYMKYNQYPEAVHVVSYQRENTSATREERTRVDQLAQDMFGLDGPTAIHVASNFSRNLFDTKKVKAFLKRSKISYKKGSLTRENLLEFDRQTREFIHFYRDRNALENLSREVNKFPEDVHILTFGSAHKFGVYDTEDLGFQLCVPQGMSETDTEEYDASMKALSEERKTQFEEIKNRVRFSMPGGRELEEMRTRLARRLWDIRGKAFSEFTWTKQKQDGTVEEKVVHLFKDVKEGGVDEDVETLKEVLEHELEQLAKGVKEDLSFLRTPGYTEEMDEKVNEIASRHRGPG